MLFKETWYYKTVARILLSQVAVNNGSCFEIRRNNRIRIDECTQIKETTRRKRLISYVVL